MSIFSKLYCWKCRHEYLGVTLVVIFSGVRAVLSNDIWSIVVFLCRAGDIAFACQPQTSYLLLSLTPHSFPPIPPPLS